MHHTAPVRVVTLLGKGRIGDPEFGESTISDTCASACVHSETMNNGNVHLRISFLHTPILANYQAEGARDLCIIVLLNYCTILITYCLGLFLVEIWKVSQARLPLMTSSHLLTGLFCIGCIEPHTCDLFLTKQLLKNEKNNIFLFPCIVIGLWIKQCSLFLMG